MKDDLLENIAIPDGEIYTTRTIVISCFFAGLLASGLMIYQNFKTLGEHKKASATVLVTVLAFIAIMATAFIPALDNIPGLVYSFMITVATSLLTRKFQGSLIDKHINADGRTYSSGRAILICIISVVILFAFYFSAYFLQEMAVSQP